VAIPVDYGEQIPNNVGLGEDRRLQRALESWQPKFIDWWRDLGPVAFRDHEVFLRTAVSVGRDGWAHYDFVRLPEYRWGIFLAEQEPDRRIAFGEHKGNAAWQDVPGEYRADLRNLIVIQGDTEPASVEQQRLLGLTAPSLYDVRSLFQVNVEEGRHLWAMVYLLHAHFGREGRDEADGLLERHSGSIDRPRILETFNTDTSDWLSMFMFAYFTDRDGKFQLSALRESGFDPLSRTASFMLKEEAYHMSVGSTGIERIVQRTAELMREHDTDDVRPYGGIDLPTIQRFLNLYASISFDLFGGDRSTNAANYYTAGLKGRFREEERNDDHELTDAVTTISEPDDGRIVDVEVPMLVALNRVLQDDYVDDCAKGVRRWNKILADAGVDDELRLPHRGFNREVGVFAGHRISPDGRIIGESEWQEHVGEWLPTQADRDYVNSLMVGVHERGKMAGWIAPPRTGVAGMPIDYEYVRL
jgi:benzoyl-CoA 2,3-dioxygenase component B